MHSLRLCDRSGLENTGRELIFDLEQKPGPFPAAQRSASFCLGSVGKGVSVTRTPIVLLVVVLAFAASAQSTESYGVFCARGQIMVDSRSEDQMRSNLGCVSDEPLWLPVICGELREVEFWRCWRSLLLPLAAVLGEIS